MRHQFAERLLQAIKANGLTQRDIAKYLGVKPQSVNQWTKGKAYPKAEYLQKLARYLNTTQDWLMDGRGESSTNYESSLSPVDSDLGREVPLLALEDIPLSQQAGARKPAKRVLVRTHFRCGPKATAFLVRDRSMEPRINPGDIVVVDPDMPLEPGDFVAVHITDQDLVVFRQFSYGPNDSRRLVPINQLHRSYEFSADEWVKRIVVLGVMTERTEPGRK